MSEFVDLKPTFLAVDEMTVAVYRFKGRYYAYASWCPHQGGPASEGIVVGNTETVAENGRLVREYTSTESFNIACPWHGIEFNLETGVCRADPKMRIRSYRVAAEGDEVVIVK